MRKINLIACFGNDRKSVELSLTAYGGSGWQILIDRYLHGHLFLLDGFWVGVFNAISPLTQDDALVLGDIIDTSEP